MEKPSRTIRYFTMIQLILDSQRPECAALPVRAMRATTVWWLWWALQALQLSMSSSASGIHPPYLVHDSGDAVMRPMKVESPNTTGYTRLC
jgi:hypothetical protein